MKKGFVDVLKVRGAEVIQEENTRPALIPVGRFSKFKTHKRGAFLSKCLKNLEFI